MNNVLVWIGAVAAALLALLFGAPHAVDWNSYRGVFEEQASRILKRDVRVSGDVKLRLLPAPYVEFEKVRIAEAGQAAEQLFRADRFTMWLSVAPLLRGVVEAREVTLKRPVLRLVIEEGGEGNWASFSVDPADLLFVPAGVSLKSVKITNGAVAVQRRSGAPLARIDDLTGEFAAENVDGPFRFDGSMKCEPSPCEVRAATGRIENGSIRIKSSVRDAGGGDYRFDGRLTDLAGRTRFEGDVAAKLAAGADGAAPADKTAPRPAVDLKAKVDGDGAGAAFKNMTLSFAAEGQPQSMTGEAKAVWGEAPRLDLTLQSRWLDLDKLSGAGGQSAPVKVASAALDAALKALPKDARTATAISVDQMAVGGQTVGNLSVSLSRDDGPLRLEHFRADMPGGVHAEVSGEVVHGKGENAFKGAVALHGANFGRFLVWSGGAGSPPEGHAGGSFALRGDLDAGPGRVHLTNVVAELAGTPIEGDLRYDFGDRSRLGVRLEGRALDLDLAWPGANRDAVAAWFVSGRPLPQGDGAAAQDLDVRVRLGKLVAAGQAFEDVDAAFAVGDRRVSVSSFAFKTEDGLAFNMEGVADDFDTQPRGSFHWTLDSPSAEPIRRAAAGLVPQGFVDRIAVLAPYRVAGSLDLGRRGQFTRDLAADGVAGGGRLTAHARFDGKSESWRDWMLEASVAVDAADVNQILDPRERAANALLGAAGAEGLTAGRPGKLFLAALGAPARGLAASASIEADGLSGAFEGEVVSPPDGGDADYKGRAVVDARSGADLLWLAGLPAAPSTRQTPVSGAVDIERKGATTVLKPAALKVGTSEVEGELALSQEAPGAMKVLGDLSVSDASVVSLMSFVLAGDAPDPAFPPEQAAGVWPGRNFDFSTLSGVEGDLTVRFAKFDAGGGLALSGAEAEIKLSRDKIEIVRLDGQASGGAVNASLALDKAPAGVSLAGSLKMSAIDLRTFKRAPGDRAASGSAALELAFSSKALGPSALIAALQGSGTLRLQAAELEGFTPAAVNATADSVLLGRSGKGEGLVKTLRESLQRGQLPIGSRDIPIEIRDGAARVERFAVETPEGRTSAEITMDLSTFEIDSEWSIESKASQGTGRRSPPVTVVYAGPLSQVAALEPRIAADAFERDLAVRRLEQDVGELERLRKEDEERVRAENERLKAAEVQRAADAAKAATEPPAQAAPGPWSPSVSQQTSEAPAPPPASESDAAAPPPPARQGSANSSPPKPPRKRAPAFDPFGQL